MRKKKSEQITEYLIALAEKGNYKSPGKEWQERRFSDQGYAFWLNANPVRFYPGYGLPKEVSDIDKGRFITCMHWLECDTGMIYHKVNGVNKPLPMNQLAKRLEISERQCYRFIRRMCDLRIMTKEERRLYVNPVYAFRGKYLSYHLYKLFKPELDKVLPEWVVTRYEAMI